MKVFSSIGCVCLFVRNIHVPVTMNLIMILVLLARLWAKLWIAASLLKVIANWHSHRFTGVGFSCTFHFGAISAKPQLLIQFIVGIVYIKPGELTPLFWHLWVKYCHATKLVWKMIRLDHWICNFNLYYNFLSRNIDSSSLIPLYCKKGSKKESKSS